MTADISSQDQAPEPEAAPQQKQRIVPVGSPKSGNERIDNVLLLVDSQNPAPVIATRTLTERWHCTFNTIPTAASYRVVDVATRPRPDSEELDSTIAERMHKDAESRLYVVEGSAAMYPDSVEQVCDMALEPDEVLAFSSPAWGPAPIVAFGPAVAQRAAQAVARGVTSVDELLKVLEVTPKPITLEQGYWKRNVRIEDVKQVTWRLLMCLKWRPGGLVARYLNRPCSLPITNLIVNSRITPNHISILGLVVGALGVGAFFLPYWWAAIVGAVLMQINSIIDGIDGELARIRFRQTDLGAMLDSMGDETLSCLLLAATGYYLYGQGMGNHYLWMGLVAAVGNGTYAIVHWHCRLTTGWGFYWWWEAYKPRKQVQRSTSAWTYFKKLFMKESIYFLYVPAAIFGFLWIVVWLGFGSAVAVLLLLFAHIVIVRARW